jgi:hypothetical protein
LGGGICLWWRYYIEHGRIPPPVTKDFEHDIGFSGDSGGIFSNSRIKVMELGIL